MVVSVTDTTESSLQIVSQERPDKWLKHFVLDKSGTEK